MGDGNHSSLVSLEFTCPALKKFSNNIQNGNISVTAATPFTTNTISPATRFFQTLPPTLQDITIHDSFMLSHDDIICLVDRVGPNLKTLRLDNANAIDSETITHILAVCSNLTVLCIPRATRLDDSGVIQFTKAKCSQSLVELDLSACHALTDGCLTKLATSRPPVSYNGDTKSLEFSKGKCVEERTTEGLCLFPNLRRLDLSYNDKLTLTGIIPLVMSLKNLCALDVSFCGDGVTRSWNSSLESIRPVLDLNGSDTSNQHFAVQDYGSQDEQSYESMSEDEEEAPYSSPAVSSECQSVQEAVSGAVPINVPSRQGLGRYVGPLMNHSAATSRNDTAVPQNLQQCSEQGTGSNEEVQQHRRRRSSASSMSSATSSLASYLSSSSSSSSSLSSAGSSSGSTSIESISPKLNSQRSSPYQRRRRRSPSKIILADRHDIIDSTPRRVGIPASFHLESWFTPQHQVQLQHLFQIQLQHQRDLEDQQATSTFQGAGATQGQINPKTVASLSPEMMVHPIMSAIRPGVATFSVGSLAQQRQQQRQQLQHPASAAMDMQELNENLDRHLRLEPVGRLARVGSGVIRTSTSRRHHRQHYYQNHHIRRGSIGVTTGLCEISAWGLSKLRAEWSMV
ncbi:hypothetical protein BGZ79_002491 [Entomortierella chlamydospora]|nr:hypothetical protein BGZ79_002491 [Entomortierella chlamydospora]